MDTDKDGTCNIGGSQRSSPFIILVDINGNILMVSIYAVWAFLVLFHFIVYGIFCYSIFSRIIKGGYEA